MDTPPMDLARALEICPHLASPAALAEADTGGKFSRPRHVEVINRHLIDAAFTPNYRLAINCPFQHAKSTMCSVYFPAWLLLLMPETRVMLLSCLESLAETFGGKVKRIVNRFGAEAGIKLQEDTRAKGEWKIDGTEGGMVSISRDGTAVGRPADVLILDDMIRDDKEAVSPRILDGIWSGYTTVAYSRLGPTSPLIVCGTRWGVNDHFGRIYKEAQRTGEPWKILKFKAIAGEDDPLGRKPGEALWPERVPLARLEMIRQERGRWFQACWQQEPVEEEGAYFKPRQWPAWLDLGDAYSVASPAGRQVILKRDTTTLVTVDWATSERKSADYTAIGVFALTSDGRLLILDIVKKRLRIELCVPELARVCRLHHPAVVACEAGGFQTALALECRRFRDIPEVRRLTRDTKANAKLRRALPAIVMGENGRIHLPGGPGKSPAWVEDYVAVMAAFTGIADAEDDVVDVTSDAAGIAQELRAGGVGRSQGPCRLTGGRPDY